MRTFAFLALFMLGGFTGTALAANAVAAADPSLSDTTRAIFDAVMHSQWWAVAAYGVILTMIGARKVMPASWKTGTAGDIVGTASAFVLAFAGAIGTWALAPGAAMTVSVLMTALKIGVAAIGSYSVIHKLVGWLAGWGALPAWLKPILSILAGLVGSNAVSKAKEAGDAAVAADPPKGLQGDSTIVEVD